MARIVRGAGALGLAAAGLLLMTSPAWSDERTAEDRVTYTKKTCERIVEHRPTGGLEKTTVPAPGSQVHSGDAIQVRLTWEVAKWDGSTLHKAIDCVSVGGVLDMKLTLEEKPASNDGVFEHQLTVPDGLPAGTEICDQGFISGDAYGGGFDQEISQVVCFTVAPPPETTKETTTTTQPTLPATTETTVTTVPPPVLGEQESKETAPPALVQSGAPAPAARPAAPAPVPAPVRPRSEERQPEIAATGPVAGRALMVMSGLALAFGGLSLMGGARRPRV